FCPTGGVRSRTRTVKLPGCVFPAASVDVQVTSVGPSGKPLPDAGTQITAVAPLTRSVALTVYGTAAPNGLAASATTPGGSVSTGGVVSTTVTVKPPVAVLPCASVAVQLTGVLPSANVAPAAGVHVTGTTPSTTSLALAAAS